MLNPFSRRVLLCLTIIAAAHLPTSGAHAGQNRADKDLAGLNLEDLASITIVTAAKKEQRISQVAAAATVINHEQIRRYGYRTIGEALNRISGMSCQSDRNYSYLGVRGFSLPGDYNTKILVLVDGHRTNNALYDQANMDEGFPIDIESIDRLEIVKGPGSALWGSNALFAVVNIITRKGSDLNGGRLLTELGNDRHRKGYLEYGEVYENGLALAGAVSGLADDGEKSIFFPEIDQPAFHNGLAENVDGETAYKGYLNLSYKGLGLFFSQSSREKTVPSAAWDGAFNAPDAFTVDKYTFLEINLDKDIDPARNGHLFARLYHDAFEYTGDYPYYANGGWSGAKIINKDYGSNKQWGGEIRYSSSPNTDLSFIAGLEYVDIYKIRQQNYDAAPNFFSNLDTGDSRNSYNTRAAYLQSEYALTHKVRLLGGVRCDHYSTFGRQLSPRAALLYSPGLATTLKFLFGGAFRAPNDYERNYSDGLAMTSNPNLQPETIRTWEMVGEQSIAPHTQLTASLFRFEIDDLISQETTPGGLLQFQNNSARIRSDGGELQLLASLDNGFSGYLSLACSKTKNLATDSSLNNSPTLQGAAGVSLPLWDQRLSLAPEIRYIGSRTSSATGKTLAADSLINVSLTSGDFFKNISFAINIYNLFEAGNRASGAGEHYHYDPVSTRNIAFDIPQRSRTFRAQFAYHF